MEGGVTGSEINLSITVREKVVETVQRLRRLADSVGKLSMHAP